MLGTGNVGQERIARNELVASLKVLVLDIMLDILLVIVLEYLKDSVVMAQRGRHRWLLALFVAAWGRVAA